MIDEKKKVIIQMADGKLMEVELVTYLISEDNISTYLVYSKGEKTGVEQDEVIYISKILRNGDILKIGAITDETEWTNVQSLLKKIANA